MVTWIWNDGSGCLNTPHSALEPQVKSTSMTDSPWFSALRFPISNWTCKVSPPAPNCKRAYFQASRSVFSSYWLLTARQQPEVFHLTTGQQRVMNHQLAPPDNHYISPPSLFSVCQGDAYRWYGIIPWRSQYRKACWRDIKLYPNKQTIVWNPCLTPNIPNSAHSTYTSMLCCWVEKECFLDLTQKLTNSSY